MLNAILNSDYIFLRCLSFSFLRSNIHQNTRKLVQGSSPVINHTTYPKSRIVVILKSQFHESWFSIQYVTGVWMQCMLFFVSLVTDVIAATLASFFVFLDRVRMQSNAHCTPFVMWQLTSELVWHITVNKDDTSFNFMVEWLIVNIFVRTYPTVCHIDTYTRRSSNSSSSSVHTVCSYHCRSVT